MRGRGDCGAVAVPQTRQLKLSRVPYLSSRSGTAARSPGPSRMCPQRPCVTDGSLNSNSLRSIASRVRVFSWSGRRARHACARSGLHEAFRRESGCGVRAKAYARRRIPVAHMRRSRAHRVSEATVNARTQEAVEPDQIRTVKRFLFAKDQQKYLVLARRAHRASEAFLAHRESEGPFARPRPPVAPSDHELFVLLSCFHLLESTYV